MPHGFRCSCFFSLPISIPPGYKWPAMSMTVHKSATKKIALCPSCGAAMKTIDYKIWGTKRFSPSTGFYEDDDSPGKFGY